MNSPDFYYSPDSSEPQEYLPENLSAEALDSLHLILPDLLPADTATVDEADRWTLAEESSPPSRPTFAFVCGKHYSRYQSQGCLPPTSEVRYFNPQATITLGRRFLPHWYQSETSYFITFRLSDSIPQHYFQAWSEQRADWLYRHPEPRTTEQLEEYANLFPERFNRWLDQGLGSGLLAKPDIANILVAALRHFDGQRYHLGDWVIMPNHVHLILSPIGDAQPTQILHSWKSFTANEINRREGRTGALWQRESYDHLLRSPAQFVHFVNYIYANPAKAHLMYRSL